MPSRETVDKALAAIKQPSAYEYFFEQLRSAAWIAPLRERGFFKHPPEGEIEGDYIRFPYWPESRYLVRMAPLDPDLVLEVLKSIPDTMNPRVLGDVVEALCGMPSALSAQLARRAGSWATSRYSFLLPEKLGNLVIHLAQGGQLRTALALAYELLAPAQVPADDEPDGRESHLLVEPQPRYDTWSYEQVAKKITPVLAEISVQETLKLLSDLLESSVGHAITGVESPRDGSGIWRSTIEDSDQNRPVSTMRDVLIDLLRDTASTYSRSEPSNLSKFTSQLLARPWCIFHRIAYYLLASQIDAGLEFSRRLVLDTSHFDNSDEYHEYWLLVRAAYPRMDRAAQLELIKALESGPVELHGDDSDLYRQAWRLRRLAVLKDVLGPAERHSYEALAASMGYEPEHPDLLMFTSGMWSGPTSPKEPGDLQSMTTREIAAFLRSWQPSEQLMSPSREGLTRSLSDAVSSEPRRFAESAQEMIDLDPIYLRGLIDGWAEAAKDGRSFPWQPVLAFCRLVADREPIPETTAEETWATSERQLARRAITYLMIHAFSSGECEMPANLREDAWSLLEILARDIDPTPEFEERYGGSNMDPASLAINTTRGQALHDVIRYALWVARLLSRDGEAPSSAISFEDIPEVRNILAERLQVVVEPSAAVRSVYGQWLPWLYFLDADWTKEHLNFIFPDAVEQAHLRDAAWNAYLFFSILSDSVFDLLRKQYREAISRLGEPVLEIGTRLEAPGVRLGQHIGTQFLRGKLSLQDQLVTQFFEQASVDIRRETLAHCGRVVQGLAPTDPDAVERAIELWNSRVAAHSADGDAELTAFGWWFVDAEVPANWALEQLSRTLSLTNGRIEHDYSVMIRLAEIADTNPLLAVGCLRLMLDADRNRGIILSSTDKVREVLRIALASELPGTRQKAIDLIHVLGAHGYREMGQLLPDSAESSDKDS